MRAGILAQKRQAALQSVSSSVRHLAEFFGLSEDLANKIEYATHKNPQIQELRRIEAMALVLAELESAAQVSTDPGEGRQVIALEILALDGLTATSKKAIESWAAEG